MILQEHLTEILQDKYLPAPAFKPLIFQFVFSCQGITFPRGIASHLSITLPVLVVSTMGDLVEVMKTIPEPLGPLDLTNFLESYKLA